MANKFYGATGTIGGAAGDLDNIDGAILADGDGAFVIDLATDTFYAYRLDASSGAAESDPDVVSPDANASNKRWLLVDYTLPSAAILGTLTVTGNSEFKGNVQIGDADGTGSDLTVYSDTAGDHIIFDASAKTWTFTDVQLVANNVDINGGAIDGVTVGANAAVTIGGGLTWSVAQDLNSQDLTNVNIDSGDVATGVTLNITDSAGYFAGTEVETILAEIGQELLQHNLNGFEDESDVALSDDAASPPEITLTFTGTVGWWSDGIRYTDTGTDTIQLTDTTGVHIIYYDGATLSEIVNPTHTQIDAIIINKAICAIYYWETNTNTCPIKAREFHGIQMSGQTHEWLHDNIGARWREGGTISAYTLDTASDAAVSFDITDIEFYDEDLEIEIEDGVAANQYEQVLTGDAEIPVLYRDDVDGAWIEQAASTLPYLVGATPRPQYNKDDGDGTWSLVEIGVSKFMLYYLVATNDHQYPIKMLPGTSEFNTESAALEAMATQIFDFGTLPAAEWILMYGLVIQHANGGTKNLKILDITDFRASEVTGANAASASDHGALTGLGDDDHAQYLLADGTRALAGAWDMASQDLSNVQVAAASDLTIGGTVISNNTITDDGALDIKAATSTRLSDTGGSGGSAVVYIGQTDAQRGQLQLNSDNDTSAPKILFDTPPDHDTNTTYWRLGGADATEDFYIGASNDLDMMKFLGGAAPTIQVTCAMDVDAALTATTVDADTDFTVGGSVFSSGGINDDGTFTFTCTSGTRILDAGAAGSDSPIYIGATDAHRGLVYLYADDNTSGPFVNFEVCPDQDATTTFWRIDQVDDTDDLHIGCSNDTDMMKFIGGGTPSVSITVPTDFNNQVLTNFNIDSGTIDGVTIGAASAPTVTNLGSVATCDINGGTIDGVTIFGVATDTTGVDANLVTGTAGVDQGLAMWNADGDIVGASGDVNIGDAVNLRFDAAPADDETGSGFIFTRTVDANSYGIGGLLVLGADAHWDDADADTETTVGQLAIAMEAGTGSKKLMFYGIMRDDTWNFTPGAQLYVSTSAGEITETAPSDSGDFVQVVGYALTADIIMFNPSPDYVELA